MGRTLFGVTLSIIKNKLGLMAMNVVWSKWKRRERERHREKCSECLVLGADLGLLAAGLVLLGVLVAVCWSGAALLLLGAALVLVWVQAVASPKRMLLPYFHIFSSAAYPHTSLTAQAPKTDLMNIFDAYLQHAPISFIVHERR